MGIYRDITPIRENHIEHKMENDMETGGLQDSNKIVNPACYIEISLHSLDYGGPRSGDPA